MNESDLVKSAQRGDRDAFARLLTAHVPVLRAYLGRHVSSAEDAHDILQDTFFDALGHLHSFELGKALGPWLQAICRNRLRNHFRAKATESRACLLLERTLEASLQSRDQHTEDTAEKLRALRECLTRLPGKQREVIRLRYVSGIAIRDLAARLNQEVNSISKLLHRIRTILKNCVTRRMEVAG